MYGNTFGRLFRVTTSGESYGEALLIIIDGVPAGLELSDEDIQSDLDRRRPGQNKLDSPRKEKDSVHIVSGIRDGYTTGAPVGMTIYNVDRQDIHVQQYREYKHIPRPGHAEYPYFIKYRKYTDWCGAGRASGRETAARVAAGAVAKKILKRDSIEIFGFVKNLFGIEMKDMSYDEIKKNLGKNIVNCPDLEAGEKMIEAALKIKREGDTCGGIVELVAQNVPAGLGEPVFDKIDALLAYGLMSIGSVKGVEIGAGFKTAGMKGSDNNDILYLDNGKVRFRTNFAGGILGGITNGDNIVARIAVKPTSTISKEQQTIDMSTMKETILKPITRRDPTICGRIAPVGEAMMSMVILDCLMMWRAMEETANLKDVPYAEAP